MEKKAYIIAKALKTDENKELPKQFKNAVKEIGELAKELVKNIDKPEENKKIQDKIDKISEKLKDDKAKAAVKVLAQEALKNAKEC